MKSNSQKLREKANADFITKHLKCVEETKELGKPKYKTHGERCQAIGFIKGMDAEREALLKDFKKLEKEAKDIYSDLKEVIEFKVIEHIFLNLKNLIEGRKK